MLKEGLFIELKSYKRILEILSFKEEDYLILEQLNNNFSNKKRNVLDDGIQNKLKEKKKW